MQRHKLLYKISHCSRIFMITILLSLVLICIQGLAGELFRFYIYNKKSSQQSSVKEPLDRRQRIHRSEKIFLPDGTVHLKYIDYQLPENERAMIYDTNDNLIWQGEPDILPDRYIKWPDTSYRYLNRYSKYSTHAIYPDPRRSIVVPVFNSREIESLWRYEVSGRYFAGYDIDGNRIGYCSASGFVQEKSQTKPLEEPESFIAWMSIEADGPIVLWQTENSVYQINFKKQTVESLLQLTDKKIDRIEVNGWMKLSPDSELYIDSEKYRPLIVCTINDDSLFAILRAPAETIKINLPEDSNARILDIVATREKTYIRAFHSDGFPPKNINAKTYKEWHREHMNKPVENFMQLYEVDSAGGLTLLNKFDWTSPPRQTAKFSSDERFHKNLTKVSPAFYDLFNRYCFRFFGRSLYEADRNIFEYFNIFVRYAPSYNPLGYLLSLLMAGIVFIHALPRRKSTAGLIGWVVFTALFNVVGLFVYLALNYTPTVKCHNCSKRRGLNTPLCPHCGADLSLAAPDKLCIIDGINPTK